MPETLDLDAWLDTLSSEYFGSYLNEGGAAVKFAVAEDGVSTAELVAAIRRRAMDAGFMPFVLDASDVRVDMVDRVFFACAAQVPWDRLTDHVLKRFAADEGFVAPSAVQPGESFAHAVARENDMDVDFVRQRLTQLIMANVFKDRALVRDFRYAMAWMCQNRLTGSPTMVEDRQHLEQWLTGQLPRISVLKKQAIFTKVNRTNARLHLESLLHWLRVALIPGTVLVFNLDAVVSSTRLTGTGHRYTRASMLDTYEVLRQFIDGIDGLEGLLLIGAAGPGILDPDRTARGFGSYKALRERVYDEVRDRAHPNPVGSVVRIAEAMR
jgi:hypothetical protein